MKPRFKLMLSCLLAMALGGASLAQEAPHYLCDEPRSISDLESQRWYPYEFPLKVYIPRVVYQVPDPAMYTPLVQEAFASWTVRLPGLKFAYTDDFNAADIRIEWKLDFSGEHAWGRAHLPIAYRDREGKLRHKSIIYLAVMAQIGTGMSVDEPVLFSHDELLAIATHEVGHALGLFHSKLPSDIMCGGCWGITADYKREISARDIRTMIELYRLPKLIKRDPCQG